MLGNRLNNILYFQRCIVMRLFYVSYKQVTHDFSLLCQYAITCGIDPI